MARERDTGGGVLDLSELAEAPQKVKLPDGQLYDMVDPSELGVLPQQRLISRYRRAQGLMDRTEATAEDADEMLSLLLDVCQVVLPGAQREVIGLLSLPRMDRLVKAFLSVSASRVQAGAEAGVTSGS